ncbi:IS21 family transposase [Alicyclobacillus fastidiosus]|uniref:IS21 family transposase n=1 Tax=Alicyclobacillus fastidiosus TaxID=392011 RepID=A0ABY6ZNQ0_9BACL|nr:IS21 family transposase [Alicyclobacillus fastidiosus]WAH40297.1 IS21 family transposase [Alicyclobacillus fastidiosus]WAH41349.1 IS21 family transposase [Alicyclobacillus fastidiosus]WAH42000.1 IS21 family transposase [Alicyclobacillus fastidiosus]WAH43721.1 IS21 family transposase [Alicyclobacillus fastidiosus]GMA59933.1 integrase [Alicyclobacillus fastidiosus]
MTMSMEQIHRIKELQLQEKGAYQIAKELGLDPKTVRKYMKQEDFSPRLPVPVSKPSKLDPYKPTIDAWLLQDAKNRYKQRHTGKRVYDRLVKKFPEFNCSYPTVNRYVTAFRQRQHLSKKGYLELQWHPGEAQADFGECDVIVNGVRRVTKYLVVSFPHSNAGFVQCFLGETAECLCQGLMDVFYHIEGVPSRLVIDNATAAGRRIGELVRLTQLFKRFQAHFGFEITFCNPNSGHEKGNVENKVGYARRNYMVPLPSKVSLHEWNTELFELCDLDNSREHYKKGVPICELFEKDKEAMRALPNAPFESCRYGHVKTNGYGKFILDGKHTYSSSPLYADREIIVRIGAHFIEPLDEAGDVISRHEREFGTERTDTVDWLTMLDQLIVKPGAWRNSLMRSQMSYEVRDYMDEQDRSGLRQALRLMKDLSNQYGLDVAVTSIQEAIVRKRTQGIEVNAAVVAARIAHYGLDTPGEPGPDMSQYDVLLPAFGGEVHGPQ